MKNQIPGPSGERQACIPLRRSSKKYYGKRVCWHSAWYSHYNISPRLHGRPTNLIKYFQCDLKMKTKTSFKHKDDVVNISIDGINQAQRVGQTRPPKLSCRRYRRQQAALIKHRKPLNRQWVATLKSCTKVG